MKHIKLLDLENEVRRLAAEKPDFIYKAPENDGVCLYTEADDDGNLTGSCLFGQALINLGMDPKELQHYEHTSIEEVLEQAQFTSSTRVIWFTDVQCGQDSKMPWGEAVADADTGRALRAEL